MLVMFCVCLQGEVFEEFQKRWVLLKTWSLEEEENRVPISFLLKAVMRVRKA